MVLLDAGLLGLPLRRPHMQFGYTKLRSDGRPWIRLADDLKVDALPRLEERGIDLWGAWYGLFGLATDELIVCTVSESAQTLGHLSDALGRVGDIAELGLFAPTVRPLDAAPCTRPGLYVHRTFEVAHDDMDEMAELSQAAWVPYEDTTDYRTEPRGLFRPLDRSGETGEMLLITWYESLASWQSSRSPSPEARDAIRRRNQLVRRSSAVAARLIGDRPGSLKPQGKA
jgi:hypothetical protein